MAIVRPDSSTTIDKTDITDMHENVRTEINAVPASNIGRGCFNHHHFQASSNGVVLFSHVENELDDAAISSNATSELGGFLLNKENVISASLAQSLTSFDGKVYVLVQFNCQIGQYQTAAGDNKNPEEEVMAIFGISYVYKNSLGITSSETLKAESVRCVHFPHNKLYDSTSSAKTQDITVSLSCVLKFESDEQELTTVNAIASLLRGDAPTSPGWAADDKYTILNGTLTILGLRGD